jgi:hypothetical protein
MSDVEILGPNGAPIRTVVRGVVDDVRQVQKRVTFDQAMELVRSGKAITPAALLEVQKHAELSGEVGEVAKRGDDRRGVRNVGVSMLSPQDRERGKPKPTPVTWETLRLMSNRAEWIRAIIKTRKNQIGKVPWSIKPKDEKDQSPGTEKLIERWTKLFSHPQMYGSRPTSMSWRHFVGMILEDILVLDAGSIEKERTRGGSICALYPVDGATIRPNIDQYGGHYPDAYVQVVEGIVTARFAMEELVYIADNPQTDVRFAGYGMSPLEHLVITVTAELSSSKFNASYFEKGAVPEGLLSLGEEATPEDVDAFRLYWMNEIMGRPWAIPIVGGKGVEWVQWRDTNRDMQFMEYQDWLLKKACAVYQIAPQEIGMIEDVNRSTAEEQQGSNESKSIQPILSLIADAINTEILGPHGEGVGDWIEFEFEGEEETPEEINARYQPLIETGAATRAEWREAHGMDTPDEDIPGAEGLTMFLVSGDVKPLPSKEDAELLTVKAQQEREDDQAQKEQEGTGPTADMPWKPGQADDPAIKAASDEHQDQLGNGPTDDEVGKVHPAGRDRAPAATAREDDLIDVLADAQRRLVRDLAETLELPAADLEGVLA